MSIGAVSVPTLFYFYEATLYLRWQIGNIYFRDTYHEINITVVTNIPATKLECFLFSGNRAAFVAFYFKLQLHNGLFRLFSRER